MKKIFKSTYLIFAYVLITVFLQALYVFTGVKSTWASTIMLTLANVTALGYVVSKLWPRLKGKWQDFKANARKYLRVSAKYWLIGFILMILVNTILITLLGGIAPNEEVNRGVMEELFWYNILYTCIIAPISEELLFRLNLDIFKNKKTFCLISAVTFGAMHVVGNTSVWTDVLYLIPYAILGYSFARVYVETDNVYASIAAHMFHNCLSSLIIVLGA